MNCLHCGAETTNGLALCQACQATALVDLEFLPVYFRNLTRWRSARATSSSVPGSREPRMPGSGGSDRIGNRLDETGADLVGWAECLADDRPELHWPLDLADLDEPTQYARLCAFFAEHVTMLGTLPWGGEFVRVMHDTEAILRGMTEASVPGWYAGGCRRCGVGTYVVPGLTWVTCGGCGATTYARDHLDQVLEEARTWVARPKRLAEAIVALRDDQDSIVRLHDRIRKWATGWRDTPPLLRAYRDIDEDGDEVGAKRYMLGDVLDLISRERAAMLAASKVAG